jgi:hypothetical protein
MSDAATAPPGHVWINGGGNVQRLISAGDTWVNGQRVAVGDPNHEKEEEARRLHRQTWEAAEAERLAVEAHDRRIASRVAEATVCAPYDLHCPTAGLSPARARLCQTIAWIGYCHEMEQAALDKLQSVTGAVARHTAATEALTELDASVAADLSSWLRFDAGRRARPADRSEERAHLMEEIAASEPLAKLADQAAFEVEVSVGVIRELEGRLPELRSECLTEAAIPICCEVRDLCDQLAEKYRVLVSLAAITSSGAKSVKAVLPVLPFGGAPAIEVSAKDQPSLVAQWQVALDDLTADARCQITVPGVEPDEPDTAPRMLSWSGLRAAWRETR